MARFAWADALAEHYSHNYRSARVLAYLLSAMAVFVALGSQLGGDPGHTSQSKIMFAGVEMVVIVLIIVIIALGRWLRWHERWLDYRALAEALRHGRFLAFVSEFGRIHEPAAAGSREPPWRCGTSAPRCARSGFRPRCSTAPISGSCSMPRRSRCRRSRSPAYHARKPRCATPPAPRSAGIGVHCPSRPVGPG
jgi:Protein of unknown function (DUF4231)